MHDLKINVGHCDLYFMVQWICILSWRLFGVCTSYFWSMNQYDLKFDLKIHVNVGHLYFMVQWFCVISWRLFDVWTSSLGIMGQYDWTFDLSNKCMSLWPIFHGPLILPYISKTIWWMNVIFSENEKAWPKPWPQNKYTSTLPIFNGLVILLNIFNIIWWMNIIIGIMDQCDTKIDLIKYM